MQPDPHSHRSAPPADRKPADPSGANTHPTPRSLAPAGRLALILAALAAPAAAQQTACAPRADVIARLAERYGETLQSMGLHDNGGVLEVWASEATGSFTVLLTSPTGAACMIASGTMWTPDAAPLGPKGTPA